MPYRTLSIVLLALVLLASPALSQGVPESLLSKLSSADPRARLEAADALGKYPRDGKVVDALIAALDDSDAFVRAAAVRSLGKLKAEKAVPWLNGRLAEDKAFFAWGEVLKAVARIGDETAFGILSAEYEKHPISRYRVVEALGILGDPRGLPLVVESLKSDSVPLRVAAARALGGIDALTVVDHLTTAIRDEDRFVRTAAVEGLAERARAKDPRAVAVLLVALRDKERIVREAAAKGLGYPKLAPSAPILDGLLRASRDPDSTVRQAATSSLRYHRDPRTMRRLLEMLEDEDIMVRVTVSEMLGALTGQKFNRTRAAAWRRWWKENRERWEEEARARERTR